MAALAISVPGAIVAAIAGWGTGTRFALALVAGLVGVALYTRSVIADAHQVEAPNAPTAETSVRAPVEVAAASPTIAGEDLGKFGLGIDTSEQPTPRGGLHPRQVIVLSGHSRSGKSKIAGALSAAHPEWVLISCGAFVREVARRDGVPLELDATDRLGQALVERLDGDEFLDAVLLHAGVSADAQTLIVDDVYHVSVFEAIQRRWGHLRFVKVDLPPSVRHALESTPTTAGTASIEESELDRAADELVRHHQPASVVDGASDDDPAEVERGAMQISKYILQAA